MKINKKYKIEGVVLKDKTRETLNYINVYQNGRTWAVATDGRMLAKVPVEIEGDELSKGTAIKADDFAFQRKNPAIKKQEEIFCFLQPIVGQYPNVEQIMPSDEVKPVFSFGIDPSMLLSLANAIGQDKIRIDFYGESKALKVRAMNEKEEAHGLIMPVSLK